MPTPNVIENTGALKVLLGTEIESHLVVNEKGRLSDQQYLELANISKEVHEVIMDYTEMYGQMAGTMFVSGHLQTAVALYKKTIALKTRLLGSRHPSLAAIHSDLGIVYLRAEQYADALAQIFSTLQKTVRKHTMSVCLHVYFI